MDEQNKALPEANFATAPAVSTETESSFTYGWCKTDHKSGKEIRKMFRTKDYMKDEPYATSVKAMLEKLGLPFPKDEEIFRGTHHDLLFLNSHGVVVRIGPTDVTDLMNPAILQPLGWFEDKDISLDVMYGKKAPLTVAIYPGIELSNDFYKQKDRPKSSGSLRDILKATDQSAYDVSANNSGIIRVLNDWGKEMAVEILLDADNEFNYSSKGLTVKRASHLEKAEAFLENKADILSETLDSVFGKTQKIEYWQRAFDVHQPLRRLFWESFGDGKDPAAVPNEEARQKFWDTCAQVTNHPHAAALPVWHSKGEGDNISFIRKENFVPHVVLYRPWTGEEADKTIQPITVDKKLKAAVRKEHKELMKKVESGEAVSPVKIAPVVPPQPVRLLPRPQPV